MSSTSILQEVKAVDVGRSKGAAVIAGGSSGIGEACANQFGNNCYAVAMIDLNAEGVVRVATDPSAAAGVMSRNGPAQTRPNNPRD